MFRDPLDQIRTQILQAEKNENSRLVEVAFEAGRPDLIPKLLKDNAEIFENARNEYRLRGMNV